MANFAYGSIKFSQSEAPDSNKYTCYYPHTKPHELRDNSRDYIQVISIDPARLNYAFRIERRTKSGQIMTSVFIKEKMEAYSGSDDRLICETYNNITNFLNKYEEHYKDCRYIIIERQLPQNYKAGRIAQHTISYFLDKLKDMPLLPEIIEVNPQLKGNILGYKKGEHLKQWATRVGRLLLQCRNDQYGLSVLDYYGKKQDDLADTVCQIEALFRYWNISQDKTIIPTANLVVDEVSQDDLTTIKKSNNELQNFLSTVPLEKLDLKSEKLDTSLIKPKLVIKNINYITKNA